MQQLNESLGSLQTSAVDIFYLHMPDHNIPIEETLKGVDQLYKGVIIYMICTSQGMKQVGLFKTLKHFLFLQV